MKSSQNSAVRIRPRFDWLWVSVLALVLAGTGCGADSDSGGGSAEPEGHFLLDTAMQPLRRDFESHYGQYRMVAVVSPSCGSCLDAVERIAEHFGPWADQNDAEIFVVWGSGMQSDNSVLAAKRVEEYPGPRVTHYYDDSGRTTRAFGRALQMEGVRDAYDVFFIYGPEATWDPGDTMDSEPADFNVGQALWTPTPPDVAAFSGNQNRIMITQFSVAGSIEAIEKHRGS